MLKSMTAYGRACIVSKVGRFVAELHSVNRKHLEINSFLPKELLRYDAEIKKWIMAEVGRGQINVKIFVSFDTISPLQIKPNLNLVRQIKTAWEEIAKNLGCSINLDTLMTILSNESGILVVDEDFQNDEIYRSALYDVVMQALKEFTAMKLAEGKTLYEDISSRFSKLKPLIKEIAKKAPEATTRYRKRLIERLEEVMGVSIEHEERLLREVCLFAERLDISEEITRFESHLQQVNELLQTNEQSVGKTLEFLLQELNRETNTIGSKCSDIDISRFVIEIKSELERVREQIQNIE